jgi:hypothetical protein
VSEGFGALQEHSQFGIGTVSLDLVALQEHSECSLGLEVDCVFRFGSFARAF